MQLTSLSLALTRAGFLSAFSPASLFALGEQGAWYDPSDIKLDWRYNLLSRTEEFDNGVWTKTRATITANAVVSPDGTLTADKLIEDTTASNTHLALSSILTLTSASTNTVTVYVKAAERVWCRVANAGVVNGGAFVNLATGQFGTIEAGVTASSIQDVGNGWYRVSVTGVLAGTAAQLAVQLSTGNGNTSYTGDGTSGIYIWGASLTTAANADKPYQKITDGVSDYFTYQPQPVLFTDAAGTTPVTAVEQPVGLMLDKSKGLVLGSQLASDLSGFSASNVFTASVTSTSISTTDVAAGATRAVLTVGRWYALDIRGSTTTAEFSVNTADAILPIVRTAIRTGFGFCIFLADRPVLYFRHSTAGVTNITSLSVRELPGAHAFQTTATSRPVLSARVNLLTKTEQFDDAAWGKIRSSVTANTATSPNGTLTADLLKADTNTNSHYTGQANSVTIGTVYTMSASFKKAQLSQAALRFYPDNSAFTTGTAIFNLDTGVVISTTAVTATIQPEGNGWYRCTATATATASAVGTFGFHVADGSSVTFTGDGTSGIYIWGADLRPANQSSLPYQRVNTATDYDAGPAFPRYLRCDGIDDGMVTGTITPGTDKAQVFAGVRKLSDAVATQILVELSASTINSGSFGFQVSRAVAGRPYAFESGGSIPYASIAVSNSYEAPCTNVLTGFGDVLGDLTAIRVDGSLQGQGTADQGTGNYLAYPLYLFRRGGTSLPFNGHFYGGIIRFGDNLPIETIQQTEAWMNSKTQAIDWRDITDSSSFRWNSATASPDAE